MTSSRLPFVCLYFRLSGKSSRQKRNESRWMNLMNFSFADPMRLPKAFNSKHQQSRSFVDLNHKWLDGSIRIYSPDGNQRVEGSQSLSKEERKINKKRETSSDHRNVIKHLRRRGIGKRDRKLCLLSYHGMRLRSLLAWRGCRRVQRETIPSGNLNWLLCHSVWCIV